MPRMTSEGSPKLSHSDTMLQSLQVHICMSFIQRVLRIARLSSLGYANPQAIASPRWRRGARSARTTARAAWSGRPARRAAPRRRRRARASAPSCRGRSPRWASTASRPRPARCSTPGARVAPAVLAAAAVPARGARPDGGGGGASERRTWARTGRGDWVPLETKPQLPRFSSRLAVSREPEPSTTDLAAGGAGPCTVRGRAGRAPRRLRAARPWRPHDGVISCCAAQYKRAGLGGWGVGGQHQGRGAEQP
jgi:hypothetical protein